MDAAAPPTTAAAPATRRRPPRLLVMLAAALAVLAGAEVGARALASRFEPPLTFYSQEADTKVARMDELAASGGADVVFLGTSQVGWGIRPDVVEQQLGVTAYNASLGGATPTIMAPWALEVVLPRLRPDVVVIGVSSLDLQDSQFARDRTAQFLDSDGMRQVTGREPVLDRLDRWIADRSVLWERRGAMRQPAAWRTALRGGYRLPPFVRSIDRWGYNHIGQDFTYEDRPLTGPGVRRWRVGAENRLALAQLVRGARATGARVLLVDMPVTDAFVQRHPQGAADYQRYQQVLAELAGNHGATVLRYQHGDLRSFGDLIHLNGVGALAFSERLALDLAQVVPELVAPVPGTVQPGGPATGDVAAPDVPDTVAPPTAGEDPLPGPADPSAPVDDVAALPEIPPVAPAITVPPLPTVPEVSVPELPVEPPVDELPDDGLDVPAAGG